MKRLTLWRCDVCVIQRVDDTGVIFTKRQVFYQMGHVNLHKVRGDRLQQQAGLLIITHCTRLTIIPCTGR